VDNNREDDQGVSDPDDLDFFDERAIEDADESLAAAADEEGGEEEEEEEEENESMLFASGMYNNDDDFDLKTKVLDTKDKDFEEQFSKYFNAKNHHGETISKSILLALPVGTKIVYHYVIDNDYAKS